MGTALKTALRQRDRQATAALRTASAALANAEAVPTATEPLTSGDQHFAGSAIGVGAAEAVRRELTRAEVLEILRAEKQDALDGARAAQAAGQTDRAADLLAQAAALDPFLTD